MYATCLFCHSALGGNEAIEHFPVGRRLAFDSERGRLWVVCRHCARWNLSPIDERWEAVEECERRFRGTRLRVSTDNIGLAKLADGLELVRVGKPLRPEFAAWRYGDQFGRRRRRSVVIASGAAAAIATAPVAATATSFFGALLLLSWAVPWLSVPYTSIKDYIQSERIVSRIPAGRRTLTVRVRHLRDSKLVAEEADGSLAIDLLHDRGRTMVSGTDALHAAGALLARSNILGASRSEVQDAVERIERVGDPAHFFVAASRSSRRPGGRIMAKMRHIDALALAPVERLALEMAVHEETERRAMDGELASLETAWRDAEEIAAIADDLLAPPPLP